MSAVGDASPINIIWDHYGQPALVGAAHCRRHPIAKGELHVWSASIAAHTLDERRFWSLLDSAERNRAERFRFAQDRTTYVISHGLLRAMLGVYLNRAPGSLNYVVGTWGKPALAEVLGIGSDLTFSLSHSGDYALIALARNRAIGVDVERWSEDLEYEQFASTCFSASELAELRALAPVDKKCAFYAGWTRKEAYVKAIGVGISQGLDFFDVCLKPTISAGNVNDRRAAGTAQRWRVADLPLNSGYSAAVCAAGTDWLVERFDARPDAQRVGREVSR